MITSEEVKKLQQNSKKYQEECQLNDIIGRILGGATNRLNITNSVNIPYEIYQGNVNKLKDYGFVVEKYENPLPYPEPLEGTEPLMYWYYKILW